MGIRDNFVSSVLGSVAVATLLLASCSVFEPPQVEPEGGAGAGGAGADGSSDVGVDRDVAITVDAAIDADGSSPIDGSSPEDSRGDVTADADVVIDAASVDADSGRDGSSPTGPWWPYTNAHGCASAGVPARTDRPAASDTGADLPPIYLALSRFRMGTAKDDAVLTPDENAWQDIGFDFDKQCTRSATCEVDQMQVNDRSCANSNLTPFDGNQCRDNEIGKLLKVASNTPTVGDYFGMTERDWNCELYRGGFSIIFKISNYNGKNNDRDVRLDMYTSTGLVRGPAWTCRATIDAPLSTDWHNRATWLPTDPWRVAQRSIDLAAPDPADPNQLKNSVAADVVAYVRGGYLYAELPDGAEFWLNGENTPVPGTRQTMHRAILVGQIVRGQDDLWTIDHGVLEFVTSPGELLQSFQEFGYCENMCEGFFQVRNYLNTHQDSLTGTSETLPTTPCNGLTLAFDLKARQATVLAKDVIPVQAPVQCPQPRHPAAPRQGTQCDGGTAGDASTDSGSDVSVDGPVDASMDVSSESSDDSSIDASSDDSGDVTTLDLGGQ